MFLVKNKQEFFFWQPRERLSHWMRLCQSGKKRTVFFFLFLFLKEILILVERKVDTTSLEAQGLVRYDAACLGRAERQNREHMRSLSWEFR